MQNVAISLFQKLFSFLSALNDVICHQATFYISNNSIFTSCRLSSMHNLHSTYNFCIHGARWIATNEWDQPRKIRCNYLQIQCSCWCCCCFSVCLFRFFFVFNLFLSFYLAFHLSSAWLQTEFHVLYIRMCLRSSPINSLYYWVSTGHRLNDLFSSENSANA